MRHGLSMRHESANLDLLRTIAVALVVLSHIPFAWPAAFHQVAIGRAGVAIFFVHTTLVLMQSLERHHDGVLPFYVRRFFRIYPLSAVIVLVPGLVLIANGAARDLGLMLSNLLLIQNITGHPSEPEPLWTLPYEVQMYLVLPALYAVTRMAGPTRKVAALWLMSLGISVSGILPLLVYVPCFFAGALAYTLRGRVPFLSPWTMFAAVGAAAVSVSVLEAVGYREQPLLWAMSAVVGLLIPFTREIRTGRLARLSSFCARYSYSVYLMHFFALIAGFALVPGPTVVKLAASAVGLVIFVRVTYRWIEVPGIALGKRLAERIAERKGRPSGETGAEIPM